MRETANPLHAQHGEGDQPQAGGGAVSNARSLRKDMSQPEVLLWQRLRGNPSGLKFRRQHPLGRFIIDFYCAGAKLGIEIDGEAHNRGNLPERDVKRDDWLAERGFRIVRIPAANILKSADDAADAIIAMAKPLHHSPAASGPPPHAAHGEDFLGAH